MKHIATFIGLGLFFFSLVNSVPAHADCTPPPAGLVAWWNGEGNANDIIGTNNGVVDGTLGFASGEVGQAFQFTTTNADVKIPASASVDVGANDGFTLETWICPSNVVNLGPLFEWNDGAGNWGGCTFTLEFRAPERSMPMLLIAAAIGIKFFHQPTQFLPMFFNMSR